MIKLIRRTLIFLLLFSITYLPCMADADDLTLIGVNQAVYSLETPLSQEILTSQQEKVTLEIDDVVVEEEHIRVRFFVWDLPLSFSDKVSDESRSYGDYLPIAELGTPAGNWFTPSSASHYSLISDGSSLIVAGLLVFESADTPQIVAFNFNQIPFDDQPLSEGAAIQIELSTGETKQRQAAAELSDIRNDIDFTLHNTAQTPSMSMIQPSVRMLRDDEVLTQFGWISLHRSDGKQYAMTRGSLYGFNLSDDQEYSPAHSYTFTGIDTDGPLYLTMDYAYAQRSVEDEVMIPLDEEADSLDIPLQWDDFKARINGYAIFAKEEEAHSHTALRLYIDADERISQIDFYLPDSVYSDQQASCGFLPQSDQFACDVYLYDEIEGDLKLGIRFFEHRIEGPWSVEWRPISMDSVSEAAEPSPEIPDFDLALEDYFITEDAELQPVISQIIDLSEQLSSKPGWVRQSLEINNSIADSEYPELISHYEKDVQLTHIVQESWDQINADGIAGANITLARNVDTGEIISGTWNDNGTQIYLPYGLFYQNNKTLINYATPYVYGSSLLSLLETDVEYNGRSECEYNSEKATCYSFRQSLLSGSNVESAPAHDLEYWIDQDGRILHSEVDCDLNDKGNELCVSQSLIDLSYEKDLSKELADLTESFIF